MVITGKSRLDSAHIEGALDRLDGRIKRMRLTHTLERLAVAAVGSALDDAGIDLFPVGDSMTGIYMGIDDAIEDIKDEYFNGILADGILGASPLIFPFTSPNALTAQVSIAFDLRGETILMPIYRTYSAVIKYAFECIAGNYTKRAIAGGITIGDHNLSVDEGRYVAEIFIFERDEEAVRRGAKKYYSVDAGNHEGI